MDPLALKDLLDRLISTWENEVAEFKQAGSDYDTDKIGEYFSALSNEANLRSLEGGWLVFGVSNKTRAVVGTDYRREPERLHGLKLQVAQGTEPSVTFRNIYELDHPAGRVILFEIPAAPRGIPIAWKGHYYARANESLVSLGLDKLDDIRQQTLAHDWTAQLVQGATLADLDPQALKVARARFVAKHANRFSPEEVIGWSDATFLNRARLTQDGAITRAALLLLGKPESAWRLNPHPVEITWKLEGEERAYEHFGPPFLLTSSQVFARIRNIQLRLLPENELLAHEVAKYDQKVVLEALHNCIAHQDYARLARVIVTERPDRLIMENEGGFFEGQPEDYVLHDRVPRRYRNPFLTQAMTELNMIDHMGYGIQDIYRRQRQRFFPLPDYDLSEPNVVRLTIHGRVVDPAYSQLLMQQTGLPLADVLALDRVQKQLPITDDAVRHLRRNHLIEGRKPNFFISASVANATSQKARYIKTRAFDDHHYEEMIVGFLREFGQASRKEIDDLLRNKLSEALDDSQKRNKIGNLLSGLRIKGRIYNAGSKATPEWRLTD
ncbi:RNA-binding domain-containing protein [Hyphomicrobiales bacterium]|uniref:RNA-binding domain-containing protein n=1 Tax=Ensifer sp. R-19 TaxID=3404055 RepID=UPI000DE2F36F